MIFKMNFNSIKDYVHNIISNGIYDVLKFIAGLLLTSLISGSTSKVVFSMFIHNVSLLFAFVFIVVFFSVCTFLAIYQKRRKYKYQIKEMHINFEYNGTEITTTSTITVEALRNGLDHIYNRYTWFDDEKSTVRCLTKGFKIKRLPRRDTSYEYNVHFDRILKKGDELTYSVKVINSNEKGHFNNFYSREIIVPTDKLSITIVIPTRYKVKKIFCSIIKGSAYSDFTEEEYKKFTNTYTWNIPKEDLHIGWEYKIRW